MELLLAKEEWKRYELALFCFLLSSHLFPFLIMVLGTYTQMFENHWSYGRNNSNLEVTTYQPGAILNSLQSTFLLQHPN